MSGGMMGGQQNMGAQQQQMSCGGGMMGSNAMQQNQMGGGGMMGGNFPQVQQQPMGNNFKRPYISPPPQKNTDLGSSNVLTRLFIRLFSRVVLKT